MKKTLQTSSFARAALGGTLLGLTLVAAVSQSAFAQQQSSPAVTDASPSPDISANGGPSDAPAAQPQAPARPFVVTPYTPPSMGGSAVPSNRPSTSSGGNSNS
jgi:hypothetical protein